MRFFLANPLRINAANARFLASLLLPLASRTFDTPTVRPYNLLATPVPG